MRIPMYMRIVEKHIFTLTFLCMNSETERGVCLSVCLHMLC